jgi:hypothetical protein
MNKILKLTPRSGDPGQPPLVLGSKHPHPDIYVFPHRDPFAHTSPPYTGPDRMAEPMALGSVKEKLLQIIAQDPGIFYSQLRKALKAIQPNVTPLERNTALDQLISAGSIQLDQTANTYGGKCRRYYAL